MKHTALDGSTLTLGNIPDGTTSAFSSTATIDTDIGRFPMGTSEPVSGSFLLRMTTPAKFEDEVPLGDGTLLVGGGHLLEAETLARGYPFTVGTWRAGDHEVVTSVAGGERERVVQAFRMLQPELAENGVRFARARGDGWDLSGKGINIVKDAPGVGTLSFRQMSEQRANEIPSWQGAPGRGGAIYRSETQAAEEELLVVHPTATLRVSVDPADEDAISAIAELTFVWAR